MPPKMVAPKVEDDILTEKYGRFFISPLESGYGTTIGNALRRVLLSSLSGAAITSIRITDVQHEFSTIPGLREDTMQILLQVKQIRLKLYDVDSARLTLEVRGAGTVTAADIICPPEVEIINPDLFLFSADGDDTNVDIEFNVQAGRGYSPVEERDRLAIGELPVDAIFSPIRRVNHSVDQARVGQRTNYDKLILEIWTDGTIRPEEAMSQSAQILMNHLSVIAGVSAATFLEQEEEEEEEESTRPEMYDLPIETLDLSVRVFNSLKRTGITTVGEVLEMLERGQDAMLAIRNFGEKSLSELKLKLKEKGYPVEEEAEVKS
ncbi:MAG: DNA-directed RNA polymerase subunit alpha [Anaerolineae bacterium]|nr:DNA-directed RNA polymerase subunit alpha [Anaerolineae bacterium]